MARNKRPMLKWIIILAAMALLAEVGRRTWNNDDSNTNTIHSVVYDLTDQSVLWVGNEHYGEDGRTFRYSLQK